MDMSGLVSGAGGFIASAFVVAGYTMRTMIPLRIFGILTNVVLIVFSVMHHHYPVMVLHMILLPLNGFDAAGYRLGYGGGYFDRTLAALSPRPLAVGVGFEINRLESIRPESHDQRLDWIVTEAGAFSPADV